MQQGLREELSSLRRERVRLVRDMRRDARRHAAVVLSHHKEVAQLKKESRKNANLIRSLEADRQLKEQVTIWRMTLIKLTVPS